MIDTKTCPHCGEANDPGRATCVNCGTPLTAYGGQVGQNDNFERKLAAQVKALDTRPLVVSAMAIFQLLFALFWPVAVVMASFAAQPHTNAEGTNYLAAAFGAIGPFFVSITMLPVAVLLCFLAYASWTQRPWAWSVALGVPALAVMVAYVRYGFGLWLFVWGGAAVVLTYLWLQSRTKNWYGL